MFKFRFACSNEGNVRAAFENMMLQDAPCGKGIFGNDLLNRGVHFKECGKRIKGFYIHESEEGTRGSPVRVSFTGRFVKKKSGTFFEVYVYPRLIEFLLILFAYVFISIEAELIGFLISTVVFVGFMVGYMISMRQTVHFFQRWVR